MEYVLWEEERTRIRTDATWSKRVSMLKDNDVIQSMEWFQIRKEKKKCFLHLFPIKQLKGNF